MGPDSPAHHPRGHLVSSAPTFDYGAPALPITSPPPPESQPEPDED